MTLSEETSRWIASGERDRDAVYVLQAAARQSYEIVAFHCQQCAEKYLKALFIQANRKPPFTHDLLKLNREMSVQCHELDSVAIDCERLTPFGTITRYPGSIMEPGPEHMPGVISWMENIRSAARACLGIPPDALPQ